MLVHPPTPASEASGVQGRTRPVQDLQGGPVIPVVQGTREQHVIASHRPGIEEIETSSCQAFRASACHHFGQVTHRHIHIALCIPNEPRQRSVAAANIQHRFARTETQPRDMACVIVQGIASQHDIVRDDTFRVAGNVAENIAVKVACQTMPVDR